MADSTRKEAFPDNSFVVDCAQRPPMALINKRKEAFFDEDDTSSEALTTDSEGEEDELFATDCAQQPPMASRNECKEDFTDNSFIVDCAQRPSMASINMCKEAISDETDSDSEEEDVAQRTSSDTRNADIPIACNDPSLAEIPIVDLDASQLMQGTTSNEDTCAVGKFGADSATSAALKLLETASSTKNTASPPAKGKGTSVTIMAQSAGVYALNDGHNATISINDLTFTFSSKSRGFNMVAIDTAAPTLGKAMTFGTFDTHAKGASSDKLEEFISLLPESAVVALVVVDEATLSLTNQARAALQAIGARSIRQCNYRDGYALITPLRDPQLAVEAHQSAEMGGLTKFATLAFDIGFMDDEVQAPMAENALISTVGPRHIKARSAGHYAGSFAEIVVDGETKRFTKQGLHVIVIPYDRKKPPTMLHFRTHQNGMESARLVKFLNQLPQHKKKDSPIVLVVVAVGDMARCITTHAKHELKQLGSRLVDRVERSDSFVMMSRFDSTSKTLEAHVRSHLDAPTRWVEIVL